MSQIEELGSDKAAVNLGNSLHQDLERMLDRTRGEIGHVEKYGGFGRNEILATVLRNLNFAVGGLLPARTGDFGLDLLEENK